MAKGKRKGTVWLGYQTTVFCMVEPVRPRQTPENCLLIIILHALLEQDRNTRPYKLDYLHQDRSLISQTCLWVHKHTCTHTHTHMMEVLKEAQEFHAELTSSLLPHCGSITQSRGKMCVTMVTIAM